MTEENPLLKQAVSLDGSAKSIRNFYANWSENYDADLLNDIGYVGPEIAAAALAQRVSGHAVILDAGCGTGLVGLELARRDGDLVIDGIDLTPEMLEQSRQKGPYRTLSEADMTGPLPDIQDDTYDGVVCAGVFTNGHVGPEGIDPLIHIAKPGAPIVLTVRDSAWEADGFRDRIADLASSGKVRVLEITHSPYHTREKIFCQLVVLEAV